MRCSQGCHRKTGLRRYNWRFDQDDDPPVLWQWIDVLV